jgi:glycosyltransferase involved in cell wall biosynthesis
MRVLIATVQIPFIHGGAEILAAGLRDALIAEGHEAEIAAIPFKHYPPERILDHILACRLLDVTESFGRPIDRLIGLKFPAYFIPHPNKVLWILHQHRQAYELWMNPAAGDLVYSPKGVQIREAIWKADRELIPEARRICALSANVSRRLKEHCGIDSVPLYSPAPCAEQFYSAEPEEYLFFPSRLNPLKRQVLTVQALSKTQQPVRLRLAGVADNSEFEHTIRALAVELRVQDRLEWLGNVSEQDKRELYARSLGVVFPPLDEDYGYVTLEAMLAQKPVITCRDSGGPLEFVVHGETGLVVEPSRESLALAMDTLWENRTQARAWGQAGRDRYSSLDISWRTVVRTLLA